MFTSNVYSNFLQIITSNVTMAYENVHNRDCSSVVENVFLTRNINDSRLGDSQEWVNKRGLGGAAG